MNRTLSQAAAFGATAGEYQRLRGVNPRVPARIVLGFVRFEEEGGGIENFEQFVCGQTDGGHSWPSVDERERCLCSYCGMDGDA